MRRDLNEVAFDIVRAATGEAEKPQPPGAREKNPEAVRRGRKGGKKGGAARAAKLSTQQRKRAAKRAADARWSNP